MLVYQAGYILLLISHSVLLTFGHVLTCLNHKGCGSPTKVYTKTRQMFRVHTSWNRFRTVGKLKVLFGTYHLLGLFSYWEASTGDLYRWNRLLQSLGQAWSASSLTSQVFMIKLRHESIQSHENPMKSYDNPMNPITRSYQKHKIFVWSQWNVEIPYIHHGFVSVVFNMNGGRSALWIWPDPMNAGDEFNAGLATACDLRWTERCSGVAFSGSTHGW